MRHTKFFWDWNIQTDHLIPTKRLNLGIIYQKKKKKKKIKKKKEKKRNCYIVDFAVPANQSEKIKENEKGDKYQRTKKLWSRKKTLIPIINGALGTVPEGELLSLTLRDHQLILVRKIPKEL